MPTVPWTKQQDFCLRLGLLRALLAVLPAHGRSVDRDFVLRTLNGLFFAPLRSAPALERAALEVLREPLDKKDWATVTVADGLLLTSGSASWGQPVDMSKSAKVLEWAHATGLVSGGNQVTERGQLLRSFFAGEAVAAFTLGDLLAWNPFTIPPHERVFLLYHLGELDEVLWRVAVAAGECGAGAVLGPADVRAIVASAIEALLRRVERNAPMAEMAKVRVIRELSATISFEVAIERGEAVRPLAPRGPPRPLRPGASAPSKSRATTKNADHQAVPRFEMLVDLGLLTKAVPEEMRGKKLWAARNAWSFVVTPAAERFARVVRSTAGEPVVPWQWASFGAACAAAQFLGPAHPVASLAEVVGPLLDAYGRVQRRAGHTPFESVALLTTINALTCGQVVEICDLHRIFLTLKRTGALGNSIYFAAGNEVDRMFILMKPEAQAALDSWLRHSTSA